ALVEQRPERVRRLDALGADAAFGPPAVVDRMVRLNGRNDAERGESIEVLRRNVLRVLDAESAIARAVDPSHVREEIEDVRDSGVTDRVNTELESRLVRADEPGAHLVDRLHFVREQTAR